MPTPITFPSFLANFKRNWYALQATHRSHSRKVIAALTYLEARRNNHLETGTTKVLRAFHISSNNYHRQIEAIAQSRDRPNALQRQTADMLKETAIFEDFTQRLQLPESIAQQAHIFLVQKSALPSPFSARIKVA